MIISRDGEKAFDKIQHPFLKNTPRKVGIKGSYLNIILAIYDKHRANIILKWAKTKNAFLKIWKKTGMLATTTLVQHSTGSPSHSNHTRRNKRHPHWKGRSKTVFIFR